MCGSGKGEERGEERRVRMIDAENIEIRTVQTHSIRIVFLFRPNFNILRINHTHLRKIK